MQTTSSIDNGAERPAETLAPGRVTRDALEGLYATGHWLYSRARYRDASAVFRVIALCLPDEERGYLALGACHEGLGQEAIALEIYNTATLSVPSAPRCHVARARLLRKCGMHDHADAALDEAESIARALRDEHLEALIASERPQSFESPRAKIDAT
jgi:tetratricopeptide (TPR) repeat protein